MHQSFSQNEPFWHVQNCLTLLGIPEEEGTVLPPCVVNKHNCCCRYSYSFSLEFLTLVFVYRHICCSPKKWSPAVKTQEWSSLFEKKGSAQTIALIQNEIGESYMKRFHSDQTCVAVFWVHITQLLCHDASRHKVYHEMLYVRWTKPQYNIKYLHCARFFLCLCLCQPLPGMPL